MPLENLTGPNVFISNLVQTNPAATDPESEGDDHLRGIKNVLLNSFPNITGAMTLTQGQLNALANQVPQVPVGAILDFAGGALPQNFLLVPMVPTEVSRVTYAALFAVIGTTWGPGDGVNTFNIPYIPQGKPSLNNAVSSGSTPGSIPEHTHLDVTDTTGAGVDNGNQAFVAKFNASGITGPAGSGTDNMPAGTYMQKILRYA